MRKLTVSFGGEHPAEIVRVARLSWDAFAKGLAAPGPETDDKASRGWYCPAEFDPAYRTSDNLVARHALTFDYDAIDAFDLDVIAETYKGLAHVIYTTASHTEEKPRVRLVLPLSRPATLEEFCAVTRKVGARFDLEKLARESDKPAQMMYLPTRKPAGPHWSRINDGEWVDVDAVLSEFADWTDRAEWPQRRHADTGHHGSGAAQDPLTKPGLVGDWCRTYPISECIERFDLPYERTSAPDRWTYTKGSRPEGVVIYDDDTKCHSYHDTDPANGQHNAFDLVRLHMFGDRDTDADNQLPITERPSYRAMCAFALEQPEIAALRIAEEFDDLGPLPSEDTGLAGPVQTSAVGSAQRAEVVGRFKVVPPEEFANGPALEWIVKGILPKAELAVVYGESGSGKTFKIFDLAAAVSRGVPWRDRKVRQGRVVYVCAEGGRGFALRMRAYARRHNVPLTMLPAVISDVPHLLDPTHVAAIAHEIKRTGGASLIVIDTLAATTPGANENAGEDMGKAIDHCKTLHKLTDGALVVLVHHSGKDATKGARGWSGLKGAIDAEIEIKRIGDFRTATITKMKDGADGASFPFKLQVVSLGIDEDGDDITSCVIEHVDETPAVRERRPPLKGPNQILVMKTARDVLAGGKTAYTPDFVDACVEGMPNTAKPGERDTRKQRIRAAIDALVAGGWLHVHAHDTISMTTAVEATEDWEQ